MPQVLTPWKQGSVWFTPCLSSPHHIYSGSLETSSVPHSNNVVISVLFVCISTLNSKNLIHFILLKKCKTVPGRPEMSMKLYVSAMTFRARFH